MILIKNTKYSSVGELIDALIDKSTEYHEDYESVKLYGNSEFIISVLRYIIKNDKYNFLNICSVDIISSTVDHVCNDDYVLSLYDNGIYIQSAWNADSLFKNEAKYTICIFGTPEYIINNVLLDTTPIEIAELNLL